MVFWTDSTQAQNVTLDIEKMTMRIAPAVSQFGPTFPMAEPGVANRVAVADTTTVAVTFTRTGGIIHADGFSGATASHLAFPNTVYVS